MSNIKETHSKGCMSLSTYYLEYGRHVGLLCRRRRRAYAPTSNTASHDNHEKINSSVSFSFLYMFEYGALLGGSKWTEIYELLNANSLDIFFVIGQIET